MAILSVTPQLFLSAPGGMEWIYIIILVIILFGGKKIPELAKGLGKGIREFNEAKDGIKSDIEAGIKEKDNKVSSTTDNSTTNKA